MDLMGLKPDI